MIRFAALAVLAAAAAGCATSHRRPSGPQGYGYPQQPGYGYPQQQPSYGYPQQQSGYGYGYAQPAQPLPGGYGYSSGYGYGAAAPGYGSGQPGYGSPQPGYGYAPTPQGNAGYGQTYGQTLPAPGAAPYGYGQPWVAPPPQPPPVYVQKLGPYQRPANPEADDPAARPSYRLLERPGKREHDGLYLRLAGGIGSGTDTQAGDVKEKRTGPGASPVQSHYDAGASGVAVATQIGIGYGLARQVVLGVAIETATVPSSEASNTGVGPGTYEFRTSELAMVGALIDVYVSPHGGFHAQADAGVAAFIAGVGDAKGEGPLVHGHSAVGYGLGIGAGWEWWIEDQWSMGLLARALWGWTDGDDVEGTAWSHSTFVPGLLVGATYQ